MNYHAVLLGGGVDSSAILSKAVTKNELNSILIIHVNYGQKAYEAEKRSAEAQALYYHIPLENIVHLSMDLTFAKCGIMPDSILDTGVAVNNVLELRNPLILMLAASYLATSYPGSTHFLYIGLHHEERDSAFKDAMALRYVANLNRVINATISQADTKVIVAAPFKHYTRSRILRRLVGTQGEEFVRNNVHSCYEDVACGTCTHCVWLNSELKVISDMGEVSNVN